MLKWAIDWGAKDVPMQMHATLPQFRNQTYPPLLCGAPGATLDARYSSTGNFSLSMFPLVANERSFFSAGAGWNGGLGQSLWLPEFDRPLGAPTGPPRMVEPHVYERVFAHVRVHVNMSGCTATQLQCDA